MFVERSGSRANTQGIDTQSSPISVALGQNAAAGSLLVLAVQISDPVNAPTDTQSNTWTLAFWDATNGYGYYYAENVAAGATTVSISWPSGTRAYPTIYLTEFTYDESVAIVVDDSSINSGSGSPGTAGTLTPAGDGALFHTHITKVTGPGSGMVADSPFTKYDTFGSQWLGAAFYIQTTAAALNPSFSWTDAATWNMSGIILREAAGGGAAVRRRREFVSLAFLTAPAVEAFGRIFARRDRGLLAPVGA